MADLYGAITDNAANRIIDFAHVRAPFLFNYVAPSVQFILDDQQHLTGIQDLWLTCSPVPDSPLAGVPKYTRVEPFGLPGVPVKLPYCVQIIDATLDFHPGDILTLPAELLPPLAGQSFGLMALVQFGLACVPADLVQSLTVASFTTGVGHFDLSVLPVTDLRCSTLKVFATGRLAVASATLPWLKYPLQQIRMEVTGLEIVDIAPPGLESAVECYLVAMLKGYVLPKLVLGLEPLVVRSLGLTVTPYLAAGLPHNPAIEQNELRLWLDVDVT